MTQLHDTRLHDATHTVPLTDIAPNPWNPHRMTDDELEALEQSLLDGGQWRPILVVHMDTPPDDTDEPQAQYRIVDGEHLWRALSSLYVQGLHANEAKIMLLGADNEIPEWRQQEIGQTINHGLRGSIEDPERTREITLAILKHRPVEVVAKRMNMGVEGIKHITQPARSRHTPAPTMVGSVRTRNAERQSQVVALVFETSDELQALEKLVEDAGTRLGLHRTDFTNRAGRYRIEVLTRLLQAAPDAE